MLGAGEMAQGVKVLAMQEKGPEFRAPAPMEMLGGHRLCLSFCILGDVYRVVSRVRKLPRVNLV